MVRGLKKKLNTAPAGGSVVGYSSGVFKQFQESLMTSWKAYNNDIQSDTRLRVIDTFCLGLVVMGMVQMAFMLVLRDTFPFNAFLAGFISCVGQFVLLISLRLQTATPFKGISRQRALGEFIFASLVLHFICIHFIN
ncbi:dolichyl-diphosphooligosaccharide-protein glycotransferase Ecym_5348 [Eremothecium cymbalariae DBVPG|uniref:Dolichyl-diphosphooligosaccharide--protein glycosyltransferase subunit OST2 n=1 Tax=Eremothecium cymbalariae (strain CBS 270.75 / DBVPG 7215 / KCTC 17166 / NRRL Y-17582) TaxID=931890 RepID=I6NDG5_ERECY|nr:hypothetical protein Ecym_5348 [Eremothecium cymbalariae DBVPG\